MTLIRPIVTISTIVVVELLLFAVGWLVRRLGIGSFTVTGRESRAPAPDRYDIFSVENVGTGGTPMITTLE